MPDRELWGAVLTRGLLDAMWPSPVRSQAHGSVSGVTVLHQRQARDWIGGRNFRTVCSLAGFDPDSIAERAQRLVDAPPEARHAFISGIHGGQGRHDGKRLRKRRAAA
jgi:hypothetical protein